MAYKPTEEDFKQAWVEWSNWRRVPTKGKAAAEKEWQDFMEQKKVDVFNEIHQAALRAGI